MYRPALAGDRRLCGRRPYAHQPRHRRARYGDRDPDTGGIFHSDRGTQYTSSEFDKYCRDNKIRRPLGLTGICYDNAVSESTFATYKKELVRTRPWPDLETLTTQTIDWIENYFNTIRRHSTLEYLTPREYELGCREINQLAA